MLLTGDCPMKRMVVILVVGTLALAAMQSEPSSSPTSPNEAPAEFNGQTNGIVGQGTHQADQEKIDDVVDAPHALGPIANAQPARQWKPNGRPGAVSQNAELRAAVP